MGSHGRGTPHSYDWEALWRMAQHASGLGSWRVSQYDGNCRGCGQRFEAGELIRWYEDEMGWLAECCGVDP
jgi:hypothetical protein